MSELESKVVELLDKASDLTAQLAPEAVEVANLTIKTWCIRNLVVAALLLIFSAIGAKYSYCIYKKYNKDMFSNGYVFGLLYASLIVYPTLVIVGLIALLDIFNYIGIFHPEVIIAKRILF